jgi:nucleoside-triphosphatase
MGKAVLLTGNPGCGKTTLLRHIVARLHVPAGGFYTQEIREGGVRKGFGITTLDGRQGILASGDIRSSKKIGRYSVNLSALDDIAAKAIEDAISSRKLIVIDEIGPMEILSERFRNAVLNSLQSDSVILGTIVKRSLPFPDQVKAMPQVTVIEVRRENKEELENQLNSLIERELRE